MCNYKERLPNQKELAHLTTGYKVFRVNKVTGKIKSMYQEFEFPTDGSWAKTIVVGNSELPMVKDNITMAQTGFHVIIKEENAKKFFEYAKTHERWILRQEGGAYRYELHKVEVAELVAIGKISPSTNGFDVYMGDRRSMLRCRKIRILETIDTYEIPQNELESGVLKWQRKTEE